MEKVIAPDTVGKKFRTKAKIVYVNGGTETLFAESQPTFNAAMPMFMNFVINNGNIRHINMTQCRVIDITITEEFESKLIT